MEELMAFVKEFTEGPPPPPPLSKPPLSPKRSDFMDPPSPGPTETSSVTSSEAIEAFVPASPLSPTDIRLIMLVNQKPCQVIEPDSVFRRLPKKVTPDQVPENDIPRIVRRPSRQRESPPNVVWTSAKKSPTSIWDLAPPNLEGGPLELSDEEEAPLELSDDEEETLSETSGRYFSQATMTETWDDDMSDGLFGLCLLRGVTFDNDEEV